MIDFFPKTKQNNLGLISSTELMRVYSIDYMSFTGKDCWHHACSKIRSPAKQQKSCREAHKTGCYFVHATLNQSSLLINTLSKS